jgi:hypothetical protein
MENFNLFYNVNDLGMNLVSKLGINKHRFLKTLKNVGYTLLKTKTIFKV